MIIKSLNGNIPNASSSRAVLSVNQENDRANCQFIAAKLTDPAVLAEVAISGSDECRASVVTRRITDQALLQQIAFNDTWSRVRGRALTRLNDQALIDLFVPALQSLSEASEIPEENVIDTAHSLLRQVRTATRDGYELESFDLSSMAFVFKDAPDFFDMFGGSTYTVRSLEIGVYCLKKRFTLEISKRQHDTQW